LLITIQMTTYDGTPGGRGGGYSTGVRKHYITKIAFHTHTQEREKTLFVKQDLKLNITVHSPLHHRVSDPYSFDTDPDPAF
jgi:hypothetical protein